MEDNVPTAAAGGKGKEKDAPTIPLSWEKLAVLLKIFPCFTTPGPPTSGVEEFFPFSQHHFVNLDGIPRLNGMVQPSHVVLDFSLWCTYPPLKYTVEETTKMVGFISFLPKFA